MKGLQGLDKQQTVDKHGIEQVTVWRRSYDIPPPDSDKSSEHWPGNDPKYAKLDKHVMPTTESLATTAARVGLGSPLPGTSLQVEASG